MTNLLKTAAIAAIITGFANSALALEVTSLAEIQSTPDATTQPITAPSLTLTPQMKIAVARLDGGRLIPTPYSEEFDWELLARRTKQKSGATVEIMNAGDFIKYIPELPFDGRDSDSKIDEIRLTAANEGYSHVIIYGMGSDAYLASFGGQALIHSGLTIDKDCKSWVSAKAKALIIDSFTGQVLGAATADNITYNIGELADDVERVMLGLNRA